MEAHPIPQNVTSFQFKLVGDMTLKQFGYLAIGLTIAYFIFVALVVNYPFIAWPLIILSAFLGFAFAFVPINSRPLDYWLKAFLKAIYSPTKRVWTKDRKIFVQDPLFKSRLFMYISSLNQQNLSTTSAQIKPAPAVSPVPMPPLPQVMPTTEQLDKTVELAREAQSLQVRIIQTERQLNQIKNQAMQPNQPNANYTNQVNSVLDQLQKLLGQASEIKKQMDVLQQPSKQLDATLTPKSEPAVKIKVAVPSKSKQTQVALTTFPNVINGIVKDSSNSYLDGAVVVIYDKEGMPVRALKTNKLGQFSGSTPLPNGTYTIEIEKEGNTFDVLQIDLEGQLIPPLQITAKG